MIETDDYWIVDTKLIFKPYFYSLLEKYKNLLTKYNELIFSNYDDVNIYI